MVHWWTELWCLGKVLMRCGGKRNMILAIAGKQPDIKCCCIINVLSVSDNEEALDDSTSLFQDKWETYCNKVVSNSTMPEVSKINYAIICMWKFIVGCNTGVN